MLYAALAQGRAFLAYDGLAPAKGFSFAAEQGGETCTMGDELVAHGKVTLRVRAPAPARLRLLLNGFVVAETRGTELAHTTRAPGVYRVEAQRRHAGHWRAWVLTNAIRVCTERRSMASGRAGG
jgi:hypothetical protein